MILGDQAHIFYYEQGGSSAVGSIHPRTVPNQPDGKLLLRDIEAAIRPDNIHFPVTRLLVLENTHNRCSGAPLDGSYLQSIRHLTDEYGLKIHMDGARLFNAAAALETPAAELAETVDSVSICLIKGLAAPVGSVVCGTRSFVERARRARKVLGGGMRQAGILAAAGIVALTEMTERLVEDHRNARRLAQGLEEVKGLAIEPDFVKTNIVFFETTDDEFTAEKFAEALSIEGVRVLPIGNRRLRAVTHYHITEKDIDFALGAFKKVVGQR
jgi:threonine aldolase